MLISLISGIAVSVLSDSDNKRLSETVSFVCCAASMSIITAIFSSLVTECVHTLDIISSLSQFVFPVLITMLTAIGSKSAGSIFSPLSLFLSTNVIALFKGIIMPLITGTSAIAIINNMTGRVQLSNAEKMLKQTIKWIIGGMVTIYFGATALNGINASAIDSVSIRTAKYAIDKIVPYVGSMMSGTYDAVRGCACVIKNASGLASVLILFALILTPVIRIAMLSLSFKIVSAVCESVADKRLMKMISDVSDLMGYLVGCILAAGAMFIITSGIIMATGNSVF